MTLMWVALGAMAVMGIVIVIVPLLTFRPKQELSGDVINAAVFKDRLKELDQDLVDGRIVQSEYDQLKQELELTLLNDVSVSESKRGKIHSGKWLAIPLLVLVPALAFFIYWTEGYRVEISEWFTTQERMARVMPMMMSGNFDAVEKEGIGVDDFIRALQRQLQSTPDDAQGWYLLGVSYLQLQMPQQSELAFSRALNLDPDNVDYVMGYTQATLAANGGAMTPEIRRTLEQVMRTQPDNPKPYMTMGMALFQSGDYASAIEVWQSYVARDQSDPRARQLLQRSIEVARKEMNAEDSRSDSPAGPSIQVTVSVPEGLRSTFSSSDVLFVYAKAQNGPPMPLAVVRQPVSSWPVTVELSDANAMTPAMTLSRFEQVIVQARVSSTGNAIPQPGDWTAAPVTVELQGAPQAVAVEIDTQMP
ncbi:MAG: c-type cytochrome biogenesis protein CcmI [Pseudomonadales bacterium]|jgi:cytochrome c-type biogenesis protein CcmH|uniref:c-type cytochrome biogenesis protein CcmI n=1 Tax=unclassified Ketobacter TaxID=2639109 RepID=UPI000C41CA4A|nr:MULTISPECIES: c-type cytochrome biogenesis protein CcmI [unclassified Ketobacter]MAA60202.1 c-type cytochrome biogenesis protein CcmI [Pseudomonadales bacterium]MEC8814122.1 c-type cytochrome biogenesis protein CcmI [Pseudomonadota bacterium]TNC87893.1 MAG: c-type cytochrome biogenesis protein CcmI [Alcanivorax sp.]HAU14421.1 c-type cytochrome biogenesis protein CcmI [Gammaproteobacteria bacterium]MAQ25059.1 c-type cytochrome biogenesis protein CcmI [Pseudomonadales bacterium]|tara:strand:- start:6987 stop:8243 length:1257 start_codon:yes stop_codon:yes gene_type:complete